MNSIHRPLIGDEIRLLILRPGSFDDPIHCRLKQLSLGAGHDYEALSYVWEDDSVTLPISLDGVPYQITKNLECALRYLRHKESSRLLWVDALCIDQRNIEERSAQVTRMKYIYEQAARVVIWLGDYAPDTREQVEAAFQFANRLVYLMAKNEVGEEIKQELIREYSTPDNATFRDIRVLFRLINRSWFSRVWCIQEAAACKMPKEYLNDTSPVFICGWSSILFYSLTSASLMIQHLIDKRISQTHSERDRNGVIIYELRRLRNELVTGEVRFTLEEQLAWFLSTCADGFDATDERDKIYALLGLLSYDSLPSTLQPNYASSTEQIFQNYAVHILKGTKYLDLLTCSSNSRQGLPLWVPDWKTGLLIQNFHLGKISHLRFLEDNKKIEVDCMVLAHIDKVLQPIHTCVEIKDVKVEFESDESTEMTPKSQMAFKEVLTAIVKVYKIVLACETIWFGCRALDAHFETSRLEKWIAGLTIRFRTSAHIQGYTLEELYKKMMNIQQMPGGAEILRHISALASYCTMVSETLQCSLYEDDQGNFGVPSNQGVLAAPGDVICYLRGSQFKFLLRLEGSEFRLVGTTTGLFPLSETQELKDMVLWEDYWTVNKAKTRRIIIH